MSTKLTPPDELKEWVGQISNFEKVGQRHLQGFIKFGNLKPEENVLDVGCGSGRMALPLTKYLKDGIYEGFDVEPNAIRWCKENIESEHPNFHFKCIDLKNRHYNKNGKQNASNIKFPYEDESFDFVFLTSIFTHLPPNDVKRYLAEITRVLRKNGRCLITYFLLNKDSKDRIRSGLARRKFKHEFHGYYSEFETVPEKAIGYEEKEIRKLYEQCMLTIKEPIIFGSWSGVEGAEFGQDIIVAEK